MPTYSCYHSYRLSQLCLSSATSAPSQEAYAVAHNTSYKYANTHAHICTNFAAHPWSVSILLDCIPTHIYIQTCDKQLETKGRLHSCKLDILISLVNACVCVMNWFEHQHQSSTGFLSQNYRGYAYD